LNPQGALGLLVYVLIIVLIIVAILYVIGRLT